MTSSQLPKVTLDVLPPDPDGLNDRRARWAEMTLEYFMSLTGTDAEDAICDLIGDILHLCDRKEEKYGFFEKQMARARAHYYEETTETDEE